MLNRANIDSAKEAIDNMDDYARMSVGLDPIGARTCLETFVGNVEENVPELVASLKELMIAFKNSIPDHCNADWFDEYKRAAAILQKTTGETLESTEEES